MSLFLDASIPLFSLGGDSPQREDCRRLIRESIQRGERLHTDANVLQEVLFHRMRRTSRSQALAESRQLADHLVVHDITVDVWRHATLLIEGGRIRGRDALHAAAALRAGFTSIVTTDPDFDGAPGLTRLDPHSL